MVNRRILAGGVGTVVATIATAGYAGVIKHTGSKTVGVMTNAAILIGGYVVRGLANG
jgi:hypothetical protein